MKRKHAHIPKLNRNPTKKTHQIKLKILRKLRADQFPNPIDSFKNRIIKIVENGHPKPFFKKLNNSVSADESSPTSDENRPL